MDDMIVSKSSESAGPAIDSATLAHLLAMGDASLRVALCAQLKADFERLHESVAAGDLLTSARAVHEVKGLAGTVGAARLAEMARRLDSMGGDLTTEARAVIVTGLRIEIDAVLAVLRETSEPGCA